MINDVHSFPSFYDAEAEYAKSLLSQNHETKTVKAVSKSCESAPKPCEAEKKPISCEIERARAEIKAVLSGAAAPAVESGRVAELERGQKRLLEVVERLSQRLEKIEALLKVFGAEEAASRVKETAPKAEEVKADDEEVDLFGSDDEDEEEKEKLKEERIKEYNAKKANKKVIIAKSNIILDIKPWDDETDMVQVEKCVRSIEADGLLWGTSKLVPLAYGINKLQISCVVEDDKVGTDFLEEEITSFEDLVQSVDIAAFNKI